MCAARLDDMIDLKAVGLALLAILRVRAPQRFVPAALTHVFIAALCRAPRERPPVILPKRIGATIAAPRASTLRQFGAAPGTTDTRLIREIARCQ